MRILPIGILTILVAFTGCISLGTHKKKLRELSELQKENELLQAQLDTLGEKQEDVSDVRDAYENLIAELKDEMAEGLVDVEQRGENLTITMGNKILFASGRAKLQPKGKEVLKSISKVVSGIEDRIIQVEGHTDNIPIKGNLKKMFPTNWELSAMRSGAVVHYLTKMGVDPEKLILAALADNRPLVSNDTREGRAQNRRVEISLVRDRSKK